MSTLEKIRGFITTNFYVPDKDKLGDESSLLDQGIIDSTGVLEVVSFLESEFGITVDDAEVLPENLDTVGRIAAFVDRKKAG
ncbi:MAG: acyl carrier protein [Polyangiaceae bacterium]